MSANSYEVEVIAVLSGDEVEKVSSKIKFATKQGKPETAPGRSPLSSVQEFTQALKFHWLPPTDKDCKSQGGAGGISRAFSECND